MILYNFYYKAMHIYGAFDSFIPHRPSIVGEKPEQVEVTNIKGHLCML